MQLTQFTDYSLKALVYIALCKNTVCTISEIAESYTISKNHLTKVIHRLSQLGVVKTIQGKGGGIRLNIEPKQVNLGELIQKIEPTFYIAECFDINNKCIISPVCILKKIFYEAKKSFLQILEQYTLADIIQNDEELRQLLVQKEAIPLLS